MSREEFARKAVDSTNCQESMAGLISEEVDQETMLPQVKSQIEQTMLRYIADFSYIDTELFSLVQDIITAACELKIQERSVQQFIWALKYAQDQAVRNACLLLGRQSLFANPIDRVAVKSFVELFPDIVYEYRYASRRVAA